MKMQRLVAAAAVTLIGQAASGAIVTFNDFTDTSALTLNGSAAPTATADGTVLRLTPALSSRSGSAFTTDQVDASNFSTRFAFRITEPGGATFDNNDEPGADGLVFVVQAVSASIGGSGQGIGYAGIGSSVGVEFDTWGNAGNNDPSQSHIGIDLNGVVNHGEGSPFTADVTGPELDDGDKWYGWVDYDGVTMSAYLSLTAQKPLDPLVTRDLDLPAILGQDLAHIGFTSGTGAAWANHDVLEWEYDKYIPEPASVGLLTIAAAAAMMRRRNHR